MVYAFNTWLACHRWGASQVCIHAPPCCGLPCPQECGRPTANARLLESRLFGDRAFGLAVFGQDRLACSPPRPRRSVCKSEGLTAQALDFVAVVFRYPGWPKVFSIREAV